MSSPWIMFTQCSWLTPSGMTAVYPSKPLDLETLDTTRDRDFPLSSLESRLRCPRCGNRRMTVLFERPKFAATG
jgi:hypothetical protein